MMVKSLENNYYFIFKNEQLNMIQELQTKHIYSLKIENYLASEETIGEHVTNLVETLEKKIPSNMLMIENCHEYLNKHHSLRERVIDLFFMQNKNLLIKLSKPISLLTGEEGFFTTRISYISTIHNEEYFYIILVVITFQSSS
jgi:hypothetical protein